MKFTQNETLRKFERMNDSIDSLYHRIAMSLGLSDSSYSILRALLLLGDGATQTEIYRYSCINKQTVNSSVKRLAQDGCIRFEDGAGRERKIFMTEAGREIVQKRILPIEQAESEVFDEMSEQEQSMLLKVTEKYLNAFQAKIEKYLSHD